MPNYQALVSRMDEIVEKVACIPVMKNEISDIKKAVFGNGREGVTDRMIRLEASNEDHLKDHEKVNHNKEVKENRNWKEGLEIKLLAGGNALVLLLYIVDKIR